MVRRNIYQAALQAIQARGLTSFVIVAQQEGFAFGSLEANRL